jgi:signal transduction histidine kinase
MEHSGGAPRSAQTLGGDVIDEIECAPEPRPAWRKLFRMAWRMALLGIPFAIFFGTLFGPGDWRGYVRAYEISLVFGYTIMLALWAWEHFGIPALRRRLAAPPPWFMITVGYMVVSMLASYLAAGIVHFTLLPGMLGSARSAAVSGMFAFLFTLLFGGIATASTFYRQAVARARAVEQARAELAQAELRALRAQINPHFLFNTLNSIASLIAVEPRAAEETTTRLAEVFRYALQGSERERAPFGAELEFLRSYLAIERTRFGDRLRVEERIEPGLESILVPSLLLQPIVENAVRHGISGRPEGGTLGLAARRSGDLLVIEVTDDGPGMDGSTAPGGTGFGLHSVRERLRAAGPPHTLSIDSAPGRGSRVRITVPATPAPSIHSTKGVSP